MPAPLAILICAVVIAILFYLDRDKSVRNSKALWIPIIWLCLVGSRPITGWFEMSNSLNTPVSDLDGSPVDATVYAVLLVIGIVVLAVRRKKTGLYLAAMAPILAYFAYCLISVAWSPVPVASLKRWIKDMGDVVMVLIIVTDTQPFGALRRIFPKVAFMLFPLSLALTRYTTLGRVWDNDGNLWFVGVTMNKNMFGLMLFVISLGVLWNVRWLFVNKGEPGRNRRLVAQGIVLVIGLVLLSKAHSSTSLACFYLGAGLMLVTHLRTIRSRPSRVYMLGLGVFALAGLAIVLGGAGDVANSMGKDASFSGRTLIWAALIPTVTNPIIGTGFDSYWNSRNVLMFQNTLNSSGWYHAEALNEAHNGYLEVYLNLGWIGICLLATILVTGYRRACQAYKHDRELGSLFLAYIITGMFYNITEAGFRTMGAGWFFILFSVIGASGVMAGLFPNKMAIDRMPRRAGVSLRARSLVLGEAHLEDKGAI